MSYISWSRAAYVFFVLAVLAALLKLGTIGLSDPEPLNQASAKASRTEQPETQRKQTTKPGASDAREVVAKKAARGSSAGISEKVVRESSAGAIAIVAKNRETVDSSSVPQKTGDGTSIFYRPTQDKAAGSGHSSKNDSSEERAFQSRETGPVCGDLRNVPKSSKVVFPLSDRFFDSYDDTWGAARPQGGHEGTDLMTPMNTPEYAMTDATVVPVSGANANGWNSLGGYTLMLRADYSVGPVQEGDLFYYAHMDREASLKIGTRVQAGQLIGYAGDTGQGSEITRGLFPPHLHLGWYDTSGTRTDLASGAMNPYPLLEWVKSNGGAVSGGTNAEFCTAPQTGTPNPSTGEESWPTTDNPGESPDIDTGTVDPAPSPVFEKRDKTAPETPPRPDKPSKDDRDTEKPNTEKPKVDLPGVGDKPGSKGGVKANRLKVPRVDDLMDWVQDFVDRDRKNDRNPNPDKRTDEPQKDDDGLKKDPPVNKDRCKPSVEKSSGENARNKGVTKAKQKCDDHTLETPEVETPEEENPGGEGPADENLVEETTEKPDTETHDPSDTPTPDQPEEPISENDETEPPVEETVIEPVPAEDEEAPNETTSVEAPSEETSVE